MTLMWGLLCDKNLELPGSTACDWGAAPCCSGSGGACSWSTCDHQERGVGVQVGEENSRNRDLWIIFLVPARQWGSGADRQRGGFQDPFFFPDS